MILTLSFKKHWYYTEKPVEVLFDFSALFETCKAFNIEFWQIREFALKQGFDFSVELLYQSYIRACEKKYKKPEYIRLHASVWYEKMSREASLKFTQGMTDLFGEVVKAYKPDKKKVKSTN